MIQNQKIQMILSKIRNNEPLEFRSDDHKEVIISEMSN
jgi:hypothetical protein